MADKRLFVQIDVKNNAGRVFQEIGRDAQQMARLLEQAADGASDGIENIDDAATDASQALDRLDRAQQDAAAAAERVERSSTGAATALDRVDTAATDAGQALDTVDDAATDAGRAMEEAGQASQRAGVNMQEMAQAGQTVAQGLGLIGGAFTIYASQARDAEIANMALTRTYGEAAQSYINLANQMQSSTVFSNDQVIEAANIMGTLKRNYELTDAQIQQLIRTSADLAAVNGTTLVDAAQRVTAAIRGEAESAETLGLTMNQAAIDQDNLTLSMSNAEAGAFRFNALMEQATFATGAAGEQVETTTGQVQQLANRVQDAATSFVEWTGPIGGVAAGLTSFGLEAGLAVGGLARLAQGMKEATAAAGGMRTILTGLASSPAFGFAAIVAGAGLAVVAVREVARSFDDNYYQSVSQAIEQTETLDAAMLGLIGTMGSATLALDVQSTTQGINDITTALTGIQDKIWELDQLREDAFAQGYLGVPSDEDVARVNELESELAALESQYGDLTTAQQTATEVSSAWLQILNNTAPGAEAAIQTAINLFDQYERGEITLAQLRDMLNGVVADLPNYTTQALEAAAATEESTAALTANSEALRVNANEISRHDGVLRTDEESIHQWAEAVSYANTTAEEQTVALEASRAAMLANGNVVRDSEEAMHQWAEAVSYGNTSTETATETTSAFTAELAALDAGMAAYISTLNERRAAEAALDDELVEWIADQVALNDALGVLSGNMETLPQRINETAVAVERVSRAIGITATEVERGQDLWTAYNDAVSDVVETFGLIANANTVTNILKETSNTILGQTNAWGSAAESVADWAGSLAHGQLAQTRLDQALLDGIISRRTYQEALEANHQIQVANAEIQEDILRIQIKQMPVMAQVIQQQAEYIDGLADQDTATQLVALGYMDQAQSAKALEVAQLAAASATDAQKASTTAMIAEMVAADPVLKAMLIDMGLISEGADGTITVNFEDTVNATDAIEALNGTINDLILLLGDIFNVDTDTDAPDTQLLVTNLIGEIGKIPSSVTTSVFLQDNASLKAAEIRDVLSLLDGYSVTTYVNTVQTGSLSLNNPFAATGATITPDIPLTTLPLPSYGSGGTHTIVGEYGPELAWLPYGTQITPTGATQSRLDAMGPRGGGNTNYYGPVTQQITLDQSSFVTRRRELQRARG